MEEIVGFALCSDRGPDLYLDQLSVLPRHGRQGLGTRLVRRCLQEAEARAFKRVSLSTFRKVPWNGPFYRKLGFREIPAGASTTGRPKSANSRSITMDVRLRCFMQRTVKRGR
jgi:GNAT superfamily N-acetyltransferase